VPTNLFVPRVCVAIAVVRNFRVYAGAVSCDESAARWEQRMVVWRTRE
jgi:hypothetical protein